MSDREKIQLNVARLLRRRRTQLLLDSCLRGLFWGAVLGALIVLSSKLWMIPFNLYAVAGAVLLLTVAVFLTHTSQLRISPLVIAGDIDARLGLRERVSSALAFTGMPGASAEKPAKHSDAFIRTLVHDAAETLDNLQLRSVYPWHMPRYWWRTITALALAVTLTFVPQLNWFVKDSDRAQAKLVQIEGNKLVELAKKIEQEAQQRKDPQLKESAQEIKRVGEKLNSGQTKKKDALKQLQRLKEKLQAQSQPPQGEKKLLSQLGEELSKQQTMRELGELLKQGNTDELSKQLKQLAESAAQGKLTPQQTQDLKNLAQAIEEALKSDTAANPEAQTLKNNLESLKQAIAKDQQLQQALQNAMQGFEKAVGDLNKQLDQQGMNSQSQQLNQTMQQMQQQLQQNGMIDPQTLKQMQQQLQQTQQQIQQNQQLNQQQRDQLGQACEKAQSFLEQNGQPGQLQQQNGQAQQNRGQMSQQLQQGSDCTGGS